MILYDYNQYLASANLIYLSQPLSISGKEVLKAKPKIYIANAALVITKKPTDYGVHHAPGGKLLTRIPAFAFLYLLGYVEQTNLIGQDGA